MKNLFLFFTLIIIVGGCQKTPEITNKEANRSETTGTHTIPIESALSSLDAFLGDQGAIKTKGADYISNYFTVSGYSKTTKSELNDTPVIYAVNFQDSSGYALLAADDRIPEDIIAVTEGGSISEEDFIFTGENLVPTENDDLTVEEYRVMVDSGVLASPESPINQLCLAYAVDYIIDDDGNIINGQGGGGTSDPETFHWEVKDSLQRMINTVWTQEDDSCIFNKYMPEVGIIWKSKAPAGCVCIALAQIMAYHEFPQSLIISDVNIDYNEIKQIYSYSGRYFDGSELGKEMLARYIYLVGRECDTKYHSIFGKAWGFAWPWDAKDCMETFWYENVNLNLGYQENTVLQSLEEGCPVFISAIAGAISGHAWVIDGYIRREQVSDSDPEHIINHQTLVHCNWGWHGICNGFFTSGIFKTREEFSYDFPEYNDENENYWYGFNTITYDNPNL